MKVAILQSEVPPHAAGGVGRQVDLLASALVGRGHDVTVFVTHPVPENATYKCREVALRGAGRLRRQFGVGRAFAALDLRAFDVVHAHGDDWLFGPFRPRVRTFYGTALKESASATSWLRRLSQLCYYGLEWLSALGSYSVSISESTRRHLPFVRECIPCAFDPTIFFPRPDPTPYPSVLFVAGTLSGRKRGDLLLRAFADVRRSMPEAQLTIVSRDQVTEPGVTCRSTLSPQELGELYRSHWVLCSTSSYEGFGVPYIEALASALPVITTSNVGAGEVLDRGRFGVICEPEDLADRLVHLLGDEQVRDRMATAGLARAQGYAVEAMVTHYEQIYEQLRGAESTRPISRRTEEARSGATRDGLRIMAVSPVGEAGGAEVLLVDILVGLQDLGVTTVLVVLGEGPLTGLAHSRGLTVRGGPPLSFRHPRSIVRCAAAVRSAMHEAQPDLVHASHPKGQLISRMGCVGVEAVHSVQLYEGPARWSPSSQIASRLPGYRFAITEETAAAHSTLRPKVIPPGIDLRGLAARAEGGDGNAAWVRAGMGDASRPRMVMVGRLQRFKGAFDLIAAAERVLRHEPRAAFLIVGPDSSMEPGLRQDLVAEIARRGLQGSVALADRLSSFDLPATIASATLLVHPAWREPFGLVVVEALALGTPVIAYATHGPRGILADGGGALVSPADVEALAKAIVSALADPELLASWAQEGPAIARRYDISVTVGCYIRAISELVDTS